MVRKSKTASGQLFFLFCFHCFMLSTCKPTAGSNNASCPFSSTSACQWLCHKHPRSRTGWRVQEVRSRLRHRHRTYQIASLANRYKTNAKTYQKRQRLCARKSRRSEWRSAQSAPAIAKAHQHLQENTAYHATIRTKIKLRFMAHPWMIGRRWGSAHLAAAWSSCSQGCPVMWGSANKQMT